MKRLSDQDNVWLGVARAREEVRRLQILGTESWFWILAGSGRMIPTAPATAKTTNFKTS